MSDAFLHGINQDEHDSQDKKLRFSNARSCLSYAVRLSNPPVLRSLDLTDMKMLRPLLRDLPTACICSTGKSGVSTDVQFPSPITSVLDLLQSTQSLLAVQVNSILHNNGRIGEFPQMRQHMLIQLSHRLWLEAPTSLPNAMTPHAAWKFGESIRRTIIASQLLAAITGASKTAVVQYQPFLASLPFDRRISLWNM
ncbi:hypothetical protein OIDMADRAFT_61587 [Oidiodendron maius Zn]|uniref:Uncharacterized protein n=1 Tax=Oidiodendron maius (strain Zn) TaxID=913774 RepID=A0A0C3C3F6_OIDMZ|nr:hypothetical protein OIDMADRAFT_61587 [Oidiodendron maius Zn]